MKTNKLYLVETNVGNNKWVPFEQSYSQSLKEAKEVLKYWQKEGSYNKEDYRIATYVRMG